MAVLISGVVDPAVLFVLGTAVALTVNYGSSELQRGRVDAHARAAVMMAAILLAAGAFTGIMTGSGMLKAMALSVAHVGTRVDGDPHAVRARTRLDAPQPPLRPGLVLSLGALPVVAEVGRTLGVPAIQFGQAALLGQMTTGFPVSPLTPATFLVVGLTGIDR